MVGGQQQQSTDAVEQQQQVISDNTSQQQISSAQDSSISTTQQQPMQIPMQRQTSDIISPLSTDPQIAQYNPHPNTNTQQHTPSGVLQQVAQQPLFQQQPQTDAASITNNSPPKAAVKKGRFRVVKCANEGTDDQSVPTTTNSTVKKGRFVVSKKPSANNGTESTTKDGKIISPQESDVSSTTKPIKKIDNVRDATEKAVNDQTRPNSPAVKKNSGKNSPIPQKKGRFLVTTGASSAANLQAVEAAAKLAASIGQDKHEKDINGDSNSVDQSVTKGDASRRGSLVDNQADVAPKKKGRFVIKTGGNLTNSPGAGTGTNCTPPEAGVQQNGIGTQTVQQPLPANIQMPAYFAGNMNNNPISGIVPTTSLMQDVNGQIMVVSNVFPICEQNIQQHNSGQQQQQSQIHQVYAPPIQNAITRVQSAISSIGSHAPQQLQPLPNFTDAPACPQQHPTEDNPPPALKAHVPRASRPAGSSGSNWSSLKGKNGRMIGGGGVGKVLHHLDTMRTEIIEADRNITSLQSDNRILRDKNKELEAKNKELLRILADEKRHRQTAEVNYQTLCQQVSSKHYERINSEQESTKSSAVDAASVQDTTDKEVVLKTPISSFEDNLQQQPDASTTQKDNQTKASTMHKSPQTKPHISSSIAKSPKPTRPTATIPRTSSFDSPKPTNKKVVRGLSPASASQSTSCLNSVANQFDPLSRVPVPDIAADTQTCDVAPIIVTTEELKLDESKPKHFDPLGTPERRVSAPTAVLDNGIPQIPIPMGSNSNVPDVPIIQRQQNSKEEEEDPFDEIVSSRNRSTREFC